MSMSNACWRSGWHIPINLFIGTDAQYPSHVFVIMCIVFGKTLLSPEDFTINHGVQMHPMPSYDEYRVLLSNAS